MFFAPVRAALAAALLVLAMPLGAAANPLEPGWTLDPEASFLRFQTTKNRTKVETHAFAAFDGRIAPDGTATVSVKLDSIDTGVDIRNVRMRFLFFETFNFPEATVTARVEPDLLDSLAERRRLVAPVPFTLTLSGVAQEFTAEVIATLLTEDRVAVSSAVPVPIPVAGFGLAEHLAKLEQAAGGVSVIPVAALSFDLVFDRDGTARPDAAAQTVALRAVAPAEAAPVPVAMEPEGAMTDDACRSRFLALTEVNGITFEPGSARIGGDSAGILRQLAETVSRCPEGRLEVAGHTDSAGSASFNQRLSLERAEAVVVALVEAGVSPARLVAAGYGESRPAVPNDTPANRARNRRIEFTVLP